ncbi:hypothetical protein CKO28_00965 [Rhodovibrio sodomensis]|uniref:Uncharacterized protein n=1 Tax=Rhodovibrio sodomensis TaxID=1088 RepID=A0ABS1D860_9PROT|nr:hypothetical protein [Rhodovibrio sodomensis]MBK1666613.1 hypothetical protein [Rhodovibrio sodomensis]
MPVTLRLYTDDTARLTDTDSFNSLASAVRHLCATRAPAGAIAELSLGESPDDGVVRAHLDGRRGWLAGGRSLREHAWRRDNPGKAALDDLIREIGETVGYTVRHPSGGPVHVYLRHDTLFHVVGRHMREDTACRRAVEQARARIRQRRATADGPRLSLIS